MITEQVKDAEDVFGKEIVIKLVQLRKDHNFKERRKLWSSMFEENPDLIQQKLESKVSDFGDAKLKDHLQPPSEVSDRFDFTESTIERLGGNTPRNKFVHGVCWLTIQRC